MNCAHCSNFNRHNIFLSHQVDDMLIVSADQNGLNVFGKVIGNILQVKIGDGLFSHVTGLGILKVSERIMIHGSTYTQKLVDTHGWDSSSTKCLDSIHSESVKEFESSCDPLIDSVEGQALARKNGFNH